MKVKTLIKELQKMRQTAEVIMASDPEHNALSILDGLYDEMVCREEDGYIDLRCKTIPAGGDEDDTFPKGEKGVKDCVVLVPR